MMSPMKTKRCSGGSSVLSLVFQVLHITCQCYVTEKPSAVHVLYDCLTPRRQHSRVLFVFKLLQQVGNLWRAFILFYIL